MNDFKPLNGNSNGNGRVWMRNIAIALIAALLPVLLGAAATAMWSASDAWTRLNALEGQVQVVRPLAERIAKLEGKVDDMNDNIKELTRFIRQPERR